MHRKICAVRTLLPTCSVQSTSTEYTFPDGTRFRFDYIPVKNEDESPTGSFEFRGIWIEWGRDRMPLRGGHGRPQAWSNINVMDPWGNIRNIECTNKWGHDERGRVWRNFGSDIGHAAPDLRIILELYDEIDRADCAANLEISLEFRREREMMWLMRLLNLQLQHP